MVRLWLAKLLMLLCIPAAACFPITPLTMDSDILPVISLCENGPSGNLQLHLLFLSLFDLVRSSKT